MTSQLNWPLRDCLVHLCPVEPFGLAILEAMAADLPVLVANSGGAGALIDDGISGFHFRANDAGDLGRRLQELTDAPPALLNRVVSGGRRCSRVAIFRRRRESRTIVNC